MAASLPPPAAFAPQLRVCRGSLALPAGRPGHPPSLGAGRLCPGAGWGWGRPVLPAGLAPSAPCSRPAFPARRRAWRRPGAPVAEGKAAQPAEPSFVRLRGALPLSRPCAFVPGLGAASGSAWASALPPPPPGAFAAARPCWRRRPLGLQKGLCCVACGLRCPSPGRSLRALCACRGGFDLRCLFSPRSSLAAAKAAGGGGLPEPLRRAKGVARLGRRARGPLRGLRRSFRRGRLLLAGVGRRAAWAKQLAAGGEEKRGPGGRAVGAPRGSSLIQKLTFGSLFLDFPAEQLGGGGGGGEVADWAGGESGEGWAEPARLERRDSMEDGVATEGAGCRKWGEAQRWQKEWGADPGRKAKGASLEFGRCCPEGCKWKTSRRTGWVTELAG